MFLEWDVWQSNHCDTQYMCVCVWEAGGSLHSYVLLCYELDPNYFLSALISSATLTPHGDVKTENIRNKMCTVHISQKSNLGLKLCNGRYSWELRQKVLSNVSGSCDEL